MVDWLLVGLGRNGYWLSPTAKVLDFGCGAGALVYQFRDLGFDAYGFDIHESVQLRAPEDKQYFGFAPQDAMTKFNMEVRPEHVRTPFSDNTFDLIVSTSVLEHVLDPDSFMAETARVLKPDGLAIHVYPGRSTFIEPHMYVPLASRPAYQKWWWLYFWAHFGGRSEFQTELSPRGVADANLGYCRVGINYPRQSELLAIANRHFDQVRMVSDLCHSELDRRWRWKNYRDAFRQWPVLKALAMLQLLDVMMTTKKKGEPAAS
jgi:SAM-dependent methyltransferase